MKYVLSVIVVAGLGLLGWQIYSKVTAAGKEPPRRMAPSVPVEVARVRTGSIKAIGRFTGSLIPASQFTVAPKIAGRLEKITVNIGDPVAPGQLVAVLDDDEYAQQVNQARAELEVAKANVAQCRSALDVAKRQYDRDIALRDKKIGSVADLDEAEARYKTCEAQRQVALAQVSQKEASLKVADVRLSYAHIAASWEGGGNRVVGQRFVDEGALLKPNDPIVSVLDIDTLKAVIFVTERDYPKVTPDQAVTITTAAYAGRTFTGKVTRIAPLLQETSRQARVEIAIPNEERLLKPGMFIDAQIEFEQRDNATLIPVSALARRDGRQGVFIADKKEMKARYLPLTLGIEEGGFAEVIDTPAAAGEPEQSTQTVKLSADGDQPVWVVTLGQHLLEDGSAINLPGEGAAKPRESGPGAAATGDAK